jgi:phage-related protein
MTTTFSWVPQVGMANTVTPKIYSAVFGDGYTQRVGRGINNQARSYNLTFQKVLSADMDAIENFLIACGGTASFYWTPINATIGLWLCATWTRTTQDGYSQLTATFNEVFGD